jgi:ABC-type glycerol-3-phosphate transport system permease component
MTDQGRRALVAAADARQAQPESQRAGQGWLAWRSRVRLNRVVILIVLFLLAVAFVFPYYYMVISSLRAPYYNFDTTKLDLWPRPPSVAAYARIVNKVDPKAEKVNEYAQIGFLLNGVKNSLIQEIGILLGSTITSLYAAYAFAKGRFWGRQFLFYLLLSTMIIPTEITLVPRLVMFTKWGFIGTHWALIVPAALGAGGWFLMRMFMSSIPNAYIDAARIDGASDFRIVWNVIAPLSKSVILVHGLFTFLGVWNDLMGPIMYVNVRKNYTLTMVLYVIQLAYNVGYAFERDATGMVMQTYFAGLVMGTVPAIIVFIIFQRYITQGTIITGLKL